MICDGVGRTLLLVIDLCIGAVVRGNVVCLGVRTERGLSGPDMTAKDMDALTQRTRQVMAKCVPQGVILHSDRTFVQHLLAKTTQTES